MPILVVRKGLGLDFKCIPKPKKRVRLLDHKGIIVIFSLHNLIHICLEMLKAIAKEGPR